MNLIVNDLGAQKTRLDHYLQQRLAEMSRTRIQALIKEGHIRLNSRPAKSNTVLKAGDLIDVEIPEPEPSEVAAQDIPLEVLYEDEDLIVINKAEGMVVHPAAGNPDGTLVNALLHHCKNLSGIGGELRPGIVHRLDKETSGCLVSAKHDLAHTRLTQAFTDRRITKIYLAAVNGIPLATQGRIENRIGRHPVDRHRMTIVNNETVGKDAVTEWEKVAEHAACALIQCRLLTGRTHQIRVHMKEALRTPILGDTIYAQPQRQLITVPRLMLHAWKLAFEHPISGKAMAFEARVPEVFGPWLGTPPPR
jgi:23S rRNA pseudouridine1911/1915/1917 synthase